MFLSPEKQSRMCHLRSGDNMKGSLSQDQLESKAHRVEGRSSFEWKEDPRFTEEVGSPKFHSKANYIVGLNIT